MLHEHYDEADLQALNVVGPLLGLRQDDSLFFARELDFVKAKTYSKELPQLKGLLLVPVSNEVPEWAQTFTYKIFDQVGMAKIIANYADDLPRADVAAVDKTVTVKDIGNSYGYNIAELRASQATGANLPTRKADAARRGHDTAINKLAMVGEPKYGLFGLLNNPNIGETIITGDWLNPATSADSILADLDELFTTVQEQSYDNHEPDTLALPPKQRAALYSRRIGDNTETTIAEFFIKQHPGFEFIGAYEMKEAGPAGEDVAIMYERNVDNLSFELPQSFSQLQPQARNLELVVPCTSRAAGTTVYRPLALTKAVGV